MVELVYVAIVGQFHPVAFLRIYRYQPFCRYCYFCFIQIHDSYFYDYG